ncbi:MAG: PACE efflux transporter [Aquabacterium sp.]
MQPDPRIGAGLQGPRRKLLHAGLYELIAVVVVTGATPLISDKGASEGLGMGITTSVLALIWNMVFNTLFEAWERRQIHRQRTLARRIAHAIGFEGGLVLLTVPAIAWWLQMGWWDALLLDLGLVVFFLFYTFTFNWVFDHVFGLPASAASSMH